MRPQQQKQKRWFTSRRTPQSSSGPRRRKPTFQSLESRQLLTVSTFQQGIGGYAGQEDTVLFSREPDVNSGTEGSISPDQQDANGVRQGLVRFSNIIGDAGSQIPLGARINSATLKVDVVNDSNSAMQMSMYRMQVDWSESTATWNTFGQIGGVQASEGESSDLPPDAILFDARTSAVAPTTSGLFDVTKSLEYWAAGASNHGWMFESAATNGWDFRTKESSPSQRPKLTVDFEVPATNQYQILSTSVVAAEGGAGDSRTAIVEVARLGNLSSASSVSYSVAAGTASEDDFLAVPAGTLNFAAGGALGTIEVAITGDSVLEGFETVQVTLTSGQTVAGRGAATVTIADDDALINEVLANVTNTSDETDREYIELIGTPGAALDGYYLVVFEGEEEGDAGADVGGAAAGVADFVLDLSGQSFGSNGLLVIAPTNWSYQSLAETATTILHTVALDGAGGVLEDNSQTYALIRSPIAAMTQGTDYDTIGSYENATNQAIGTGVGILDQLPVGAQIVDSVGVVEGGGNDRDRVATTELEGHPGIHVHQPTPFTPGGNVTSDAVSRRAGQTLPNSIGAWFNGDITNGDGSTGPIQYSNDTFFVSVVAPDGSVLTPGAPNILRTVHFRVADQNKEVAEAAGSVTLRIERTGSLDEEVSVTYRTVDIGSATEDVDYTGVQETILLGSGEAFRDIAIQILPDSEPEGFERFRVDITEVSAGYLITDGKPSQFGALNGEAVVTITDADVSTAIFQNDLNGYSGTSDAYLDGEEIFVKYGQDPVIRVDQVKGEGEDEAAAVRPQQGLIRFDNMFGDAANQVPKGATIFDAFVTVNVQNVASGADVRFFRMLQNWEEINATWLDPQGSRGSSILNGVTPDDIEATAVPDFRVPNPGRAGLVEIPLNVDTIQGWANGSLDNFGWSIVSDAGSLWAFNSSEAFLIGTIKPELTILYTEPAPTESGTMSFSTDEFVVNEDGTATITVNRIGGSNGAVTVQWQVTATAESTGDLNDISGVTSGSLSFASGELYKTFSLDINDDSELEVNETLSLSLSGDGVKFNRQEAVLTIRDNDFNPLSGDMLLNEMWINSPGNDPPHEFVELKGRAGIGMGSLYYVAIEGLVGDREGSLEKVVDLGAYRNGTNGLAVLTPDAEDFAFRVSDQATQIPELGTVGQENVSTQNDSTTYMLLYSPFTSLTTTEFDYDWDNDGALELPNGVQIVDSVGVRVLGVEDQLYGPETNRLEFAVTDPDIDAISRFLGRSQRNAGNAWFGGDLFPAGDDYLMYETAEAFDLPVTGTALSVGEPNTAKESPLVSLLSVVANTDGSVTATFSGPVSQLCSGDGSPSGPAGSGITITDANGVPLPTVTLRPTVTGLGTDTLTLTFGAIPAGSYRLNFVGNAIIANGRAVDVANNGSQIDGFHTFTFQSGGGDPDDINGDGIVDVQDLDLLGTQAANGIVEIARVDEFRQRQRIPLGDSNYDHQFGSDDFVTAFAAGRYETGTEAVWSQGDWNSDGGFTSADFVAAFAEGLYETGPLPSSDAAARDQLLASALEWLQHDETRPLRKLRS